MNPEYLKHREYRLDYQKNSPRAKEARERYRLKNLDKYRKYTEKYRLSDKGQITLILNRYKQRAIRSGLPFEITSDWISKYPELCPILGIPLILPAPETSPDSISIFMKDTLLGYTLENCQIVSSRVIDIIGDATAEELEKILPLVSNCR